MDHQPRIIAGSARSGTTWVVDALAAANRATTVFEPLNPEAIEQALTLANQRLGVQCQNAAARDFFDALFYDRAHRNLWTLARTYPEELKLGAGRTPHQVLSKAKAALTNYWRYGRPRQGGELYKLVRASLMLGWLEHRYRARIAFVIRHPGAVVASRVRRCWPWRPTLHQYLLDEEVRHLLGDAHPWAQRIDDALTGHTAIWCVQHAVALRDWQTSQFTVHFYEHLTNGHDGEWRRLADQLGLDALPSRAVLARPSQQADRGAKGAMISASPRWRSALSRPELIRMDDTLQRFGSHLYTTGRDSPTDATEQYLGPR